MGRGRDVNAVGFGRPGWAVVGQRRGSVANPRGRGRGAISLRALSPPGRVRNVADDKGGGTGQFQGPGPPKTERQLQARPETITAIGV